MLLPNCVKVTLVSKEKEAAITELIDLLDSQGQLTDRDAALEAVLEREKILSTGIGSAIAIPHAKCNAVKELVMAIGIAAEPIEFESIDDEPVTIVILLVSPPDQIGLHIQTLARISKLMLDEEFKKQLENAASSEQLYDLISSRQSE
jgi:fructose-specific phosphotransferase system IIA component